MTFKTIATACLGGLALFAAAGPATAQNGMSTFSNCDGYGMPASGGDGMTEYANVWGIFNLPGYGTTARTTANYGDAALGQCDAALSDAKLKPEFWMRRVNLLRARALHNLERGDPAAALIDLDRAAAAVQVPGDPFYSRSLGLSLDLTRAYALRQQGNAEDSARIAMAAWSKRPYTRSLAVGGLFVIGEGSQRPEAEAMRQAVSRFQPSANTRIYVDLIEQRRWNEAIGLYPQIRPPLSQKRVNGYGGAYDLRYADSYKDGMFRITYAGTHAYALAATGRYADARAALEHARVTLNWAVETPQAPQPRKPGGKVPKDRLAEHEREVARRQRLERDGRKLLEVWTTFVEQRILVGEGKIEEVFLSLGRQAVPQDELGVEFIDALLAKLPPAETAAIDGLKALRARIDQPPSAERTTPEDSIKALFDYLPDPETSARLPRYKKSAVLFGSVDGFTVTPRDRPMIGEAETVSIRFRGVAAPAVVVEEMAILKAADLAREKGVTGFVILDRDDVSHSVTSTYYGVPLRTDPNGYETTLTVALVDLAKPAAPFDGATWRIIDANAVYDALSPIYIRPETRRGKS